MEIRNPTGSTYASLFTLSFTALLAGQVIAILGDRLNNIALIEFLSTETSRFAEPGSTFELSKLALAMTLPSLFLGPFVGAFIDRANRKKVLIVTDVVRGVAAFAIPLVRPGLPLWTVYVIVGVLYLASIFFLPARCAIISEIVSRERLIKANSILSLGATVATIVGFGVGGVLAARAGWRVALFIDGLAYFISAGALCLVTTRLGNSEPRASVHPAYLQTIKEAIGEIRRSKGVRVGVFTPPLLVLGATTAYVLGVAIIEGMSSQGTMHVGFLVSLAGIGMAIGCYFTGRLLHGHNRARVAIIATPFSLAPLMVIGLTEALLPVGLAVAAAGFAAGPVFVSSETAVQEEAPRRRQATVFALRDMLMKISVALAATAAAIVATLIGLRMALVVLLISCLMLVVPALVYQR